MISMKLVGVFMICLGIALVYVDIYQKPAQAMTISDPPTDLPIWYQAFQEFMCRLYRIFGGDCNDLDWGDGGSTAANQIRGLFLAVGIPQGSEQELEEALGDLLNHLQSSSNILTPQAETDVLNMTDDIYDALN